METPSRTAKHVDTVQLSVFVTDAQGGFRTTFNVPNSVSVFGVSVHGQACAPEPKANWRGVAMTDGLKMAVGL